MSLEDVSNWLKAGIRNYFGVCPLCLSENSMTVQISNVYGAKDYMSCAACGAKWHIGIGKLAWNLTRIQWAELILDGIDKKGTLLLGRREKPEFWQHMALKGLRETPQVEETPQIEEQTSTIIKEKETIKEIVKVRCRSCGTLCLETLDKCPNCGARL